VQPKEDQSEDAGHNESKYFSFPDFDTYELLEEPKPSLSLSEGSVNALRSCGRKPLRTVPQSQGSFNTPKALQTYEENEEGEEGETYSSERPKDTSITTLSNVWNVISSALTSKPQDPLLSIDDDHSETQAIFQFYVDVHIYRARKKNENRGEEQIKKTLHAQWEDMSEVGRRKWAERYHLFEHDERLEDDEETLYQIFGKQKKRRGSNMEETGEEWNLQDMDWKTIWKGRARTNVHGYFKENL